MFYLYALPEELPAASGGSAKALAWAAASTGTEAAALGRSRAITADLWGSSAPGPATTIHYAAGSNFDSSGPTYVYLLQPYGFNLADASNVDEVDELPTGVKALVYIGLTNGVDSAFLSFMAPFLSGSHPNLWGFYLADEPDPNVVPAANLKAEADWIHANFPGVQTFIVLQNMGTPNAPTYYPTTGQPYTPATTSIDLFGVDPYPVRPQFSGGIDLTTIAASLHAAIDAPGAGLGIPLAQIVPVYQAFGGGGYPSWTLPTPDQLQEILSTWQTLAPAPVFDMTYAWGSQLGDSSMAGSPDLQQVMTAHNLQRPASLGRSRALAWAAASSGTLGAPLTSIHVLAWSAAGAATAAATLGRSRALVAAETAACIAGATLTRARALAASETAIGRFAATLNPLPNRLAWAAAAHGTLSASLTSIHVLSAGLGAAGTVTASLTRSRALALATGSSGALVAPLISAHALVLAVTGTGTLGATLLNPLLLDWAASATGTFTASLTPNQRAVAAAIASSGTFAATLAKLRGTVPGRLVIVPASYSYGLTSAFAPIEPLDVDQFTFDWTSRTSADVTGDPIVSATVTADDVTVAQPPVLISPLVQVQCSAPVAGDSIALRCAVTFRSGRVLHWTARLPAAQP